MVVFIFKVFLIPRRIIIYLLKGFRPALTHPSSAHCALTPVGNFNRFFQRKRGRPFRRRLLQIPASKTHLAGVSSFIRPKWPSQHSLWILIRCTTSISLTSSHRSLLDRMLKSSAIRTGPEILRWTFLWNILQAAASVLDSVHAFAP